MYYPPYVSVAERKSKAEKVIAKLKKKNPKIFPIEVENKNIVTSWWGKSWTKNLESYADFSNRLGRGRSYVRHGSVLDLQIKEGLIEALVLGSTQYKIEIKIKKLDDKKWKALQKEAVGEISSVAQVLEGNFPKELANIFTTKDKGLFPSPKEINLDCSCPDWAKMCKHVAATLYGVGVRLDQDPSLFFTMRSIDLSKLVSKVIEQEQASLSERARKVKSKRIIKSIDKNLEKLFGI